MNIKTASLLLTALLLAFPPLARLVIQAGPGWESSSARETDLQTDPSGVPGLGSSGTATPARTAPSANPVDEEVQDLRRDLESILTTAGTRRGNWAVLAVSMDRGDTLLSLRSDQPMVPASNMKLLSTAAALHYLGPDFESRTFLLADGELAGSVLEGDLVLFGTGDPTHSERFYPTETAPMDSLAAQLLRHGLLEVRGDLVVDGSFFQGPDLHPDWDPADFNDAFAAPISAVSLAENVVTVRVEAGSWVGARPSIHTIPESAGVPIENLSETLPRGIRSRVWLSRETPGDPIGIVGEIPLGGADVWRRLPVSDPLRFTGLQMKRMLEAHGVTVLGDVVTIRDPASSVVAPPGHLHLPTLGGTPRILASIGSARLVDVLRVINKESNNFLAETVAKALGRTVLGDGSFSGGGKAIEKFLVEEVGVDPEEIQVQDGSGLSPRNQATALVFIRTLEFMAASPHWDTYLATLPEAGVRRELGRMYGSPAAGNLRAKTGTMEGVSALSGIVRTRSRERILFSILSNDMGSSYRAKRVEDRIGIRLASLTRPLPD